MTIPPRPKTQAITTHVPEHLVEGFLETTTEFLTNARGGKTASQRAAELRAQDKDQGWTRSSISYASPSATQGNRASSRNSWPAYTTGRSFLLTSLSCAGWIQTCSSTVSTSCGSMVGRRSRFTNTSQAARCGGSG